MKLTYAISLVAFAISLAGCASAPEKAAPATAKDLSELGSTKPAGPYAVILMSPAGNLQPGSVPFMAHVSKDGKDVTDAKVELDLAMPSMQMDGPHSELKHTTGNAYEGTATIMASPYAAKVNVSGPSGQGTAEFDFTVK